MLYIFLIFVIVVGAYFTIRYLILISSIKQITKEAEQFPNNPILYLPAPNKYLAKMLIPINSIFNKMHKSNIEHINREKRFQEEIENISHDLRTPLTVILGYLKYLKDNENETGEILDVIENKSEMMNSLVNGFYDFSILNNNSYELELQDVDITRVIKESLMGNYQLLKDSSIEVDVDILDEACIVVADKLALERIFNNLIQNARNYANSYLKIKLEKVANKVEVTFINDTKDLKAHQVEKLFDRFYHQVNTKYSSGLGLAIAKGLSTMLNADLSVSFINQEINFKFEIESKD